MNQHKQRQPANPSTKSGFTIIESLIAIIVVTILMIGLAPIITMAVANRVQARRVERATQAASSYIDGVNSGNIPFVPNSDNEQLKNAFSAGSDFSDVEAPSQGSLNCDPSGYCTSPQPPNSVLYCVDNPEDGEECTGYQDLIIQAIGKIPPPPTTGIRRYTSYRLGVRVYRADAFTSDFVEGFTNQGTQLSATGGIGLSKTQAPLAQITTEIGVDSSTFQTICDEANIDC